MKEISIFVLVLSGLYLIKNSVSIIMSALSEDPETIKFTIIEKILLYLSISYVISFIIV